MLQKARRDQNIMDHQIGLSEALHGTQGEKAGIAGAGADEEDQR